MQPEPNVIYLTLYKGRRDGAWYQPDIAAARLSDWIIRTLTRSPYSHCELAVPCGLKPCRCPMLSGI